MIMMMSKIFCAPDPTVAVLITKSFNVQEKSMISQFCFHTFVPMTYTCETDSE